MHDILEILVTAFFEFRTKYQIKMNPGRIYILIKNYQSPEPVHIAPIPIPVFFLTCYRIFF